MESGHSGGGSWGSHTSLPSFLPRAGQLWLLSPLISAWGSFLHRTSQGRACPPSRLSLTASAAPIALLTEESTAVSNSEPSLQPRNSLRLCTPLRAAHPPPARPAKGVVFCLHRPTSRNPLPLPVPPLKAEMRACLDSPLFDLYIKIPLLAFCL